MSTKPDLRTAAQPSNEHQRAIMEAERNASLGAYSRVVYLTGAESRLYEAGFTNGWDRRDRLASHGQAPAVASKAVLAAIRAENLQLVRTGDDAFMLVTLKQAAPQQEVHHLAQALTDPENQPNQYGVQFLMHGPKMAFKIGNRQFCLDYEPTEPGEFEFMRDALIDAFSIFTPDVKIALGAQQPAPAGASYEKALEEALRERDDADDFIDALLDEVLGTERAEWSSAYGRAEALEEVRERITALHKPAVDRAWKHFEVATQQAGEVRPVTPYTCPKCHALWLHWPAEQTGFGLDTLNCRSADHCHYCEKASVEQLQRLERIPAALHAPQPSPTAQADSQPAPDERDDFEKVFPLPSGCIRVGTGYASTGYSNWAAHTHCERWQGWRARAAQEDK